MLEGFKIGLHKAEFPEREGGNPRFRTRSDFAQHDVTLCIVYSSFNA